MSAARRHQHRRPYLQCLICAPLLPIRRAIFITSRCDWHSCCPYIMWLAGKAQINHHKRSFTPLPRHVHNTALHTYQQKLRACRDEDPLTLHAWRVVLHAFWVKPFVAKRRKEKEQEMQTQTDWGSHASLPVCSYSTVVSIKMLLWQQGSTVRESKLWGGVFFFF